MPYYNLTFTDLQGMSLAYIGQSTTKSRYGVFTGQQVNIGLVKMYDYADGVEDIAHYTLVPGIRSYLTPMGFLRDLRINVNNLRIRKTELRANDYYSTGTSMPCYFTYFGQPRKRIVLGPQAPDSNYPMDVWFFRTPRIMTQPSEVPELPLHFQHAPSLYAGAQLCLMNEMTQMGNMLLQSFKEQQLKFQAFCQTQSDSDPPMVARTYDGYGDINSL